MLLSLLLLASRPAHTHNAVESAGCGRAWASILRISDRTRPATAYRALQPIECNANARACSSAPASGLSGLGTPHACPQKRIEMSFAPLVTNVTLREPEERFRVWVSRSMQPGKKVASITRARARHCEAGERPGSFSRERSGEAPLQSAALQPTRPLRVLRLNGRVHAGTDAGSESGQVCTGVETDSSRMREPVRRFEITSEDMLGVRT